MAVRELVRAAYAKWVPVIGREPLPMGADYDAAIRAHRIDLLFAGLELVGLIEVIRHPDHLFIENVAVAPARQGMGVGRRLMVHAEQLVLEAGGSELRLLTNAAFSTNVAFYEKCGFHIEHREPFRGGHCVHMRKHVST